MAEGNTKTTVEPDVLIRKKRSSRAGHRASATRITEQVDPAITASNASKQNLSCLDQKGKPTPETR